MATRDTISFKLNTSLLDEGGRFIILIAEFNSTIYTLLVIYAPNKQQIRFIRRTIAKACSIQKGHLLLCRDFNIPIDPEIDTTSRNPAKKSGHIRNRHWG